MKIKNFNALIVLSILLVSCTSTPSKEKKPTQSVEINQSDDISVIDDIEEVDDIVELEDEYSRSTTALSPNDLVTREEFADDKATILKLIEELKVIMNKGNVQDWLKYIDQDSIKYYSTPANIRKAQKKLPDKTIQLKGIGDYFKHVFIPARKRSEVKEIRYISKNEIKAVDVKEDGSIIVYYQFVKINNKWYVHIPTL